jgi:hypothetical protein
VSWRPWEASGTSFATLRKDAPAEDAMRIGRDRAVWAGDVRWPEELQERPEAVSWR